MRPVPEYRGRYNQIITYYPHPLQLQTQFTNVQFMLTPSFSIAYGDRRCQQFSKIKITLTRCDGYGLVTWLITHRLSCYPRWRRFSFTLSRLNSYCCIGYRYCSSPCGCSTCSISPYRTLISTTVTVYILRFH